MKIQCPTCRQNVSADQVNMEKDLAFCQQCNEGFKISESIDQDAVNHEYPVNPDDMLKMMKNMPIGSWFKKERDRMVVALFQRYNLIDQTPVNSDVLKNPPKGAWFRKERDRTIIGASTRSPIAFFLVPFTCVWSGFSIGDIYGSQIITGRFNLGSFLLGLPFLLGSIFLCCLALMSVFGKVEVSVGRLSSVFVGVGRLGWTRKFDWSKVRTIWEGMTYSNKRQQPAIMMDGQERLTFGTGLNETRRRFIINVLKYLKSKSL